MKTLEFRSDTFTLPTPAMRTAIAEAEVGDDQYGEDPTVNRLEERAAQLVGKEAGVYVGSGMLGNLCGAVLTFLYFREIDPIAGAGRLGAAELAFFVVGFSLLAVAGRVTSALWMRPVAHGGLEPPTPAREGLRDLVRCCDDLRCVPRAELDFRAGPDIVFGFFQKLQETFDRFTCNLLWLEQRTSLISHTIDAPVSVIAVWVANVVLHMADDRIVPVENVERTVWRDIDGRWTEIRIVG